MIITWLLKNFNSFNRLIQDCRLKLFNRHRNSKNLQIILAIFLKSVSKDLLMKSLLIYIAEYINQEKQ
jgi:hypothetical protein